MGRDHDSAMAEAQRRIAEAQEQEAEYLDLSGLHLTSLPPEIGDYTKLDTLDLANNQLNSMPPEIGRLTKLDVLILSNNRLTSLPPEIGHLTKLRGLDLNGNKLSSLPSEFGNLTALIVLYMEVNQLTSLPPTFAKLTSLNTLRLQNNPLPKNYVDALDDGIPNLFALLRSLDGDTAPIYEAKLVVTGEGQVGKSWGLAALCGDDPCKAVGSDNTTWGIERGELTLPHPDESDTDIHLNTWDFGGQAVYRVTHQFFFSEQALFLLVWNPRKGPTQCRVRHWLRTIALRTGSDVPPGAPEGTKPKPRARVIMVATHAKADGGSYSPDYGHESLDADLQAMIVDEIEIDSEKDFNIQKLRDLIAHHAAKLPDMGSPLNTTWAAARDAALGLRAEHPWITFERFADLCAANGVSDTADQRTLASTFMNRLGRAVWYGPGAGEATETADALLADTLVLDAVWLSRAFVQVLEHAPTRKAGGMLDHRSFGKIWTDHEREEWHVYAPGEYDRLTRMMRRFDVALPTRASSGERSLVPQLVPTLRPTLPWTKPEDANGRGLVRLACQLDYEAEGLMARFIAATEPYHVYDNGTGLFWQDGVFLSDHSFENQALITVDGTEKPLISIDVSGDQPGFFMKTLYETLQGVIDFWKGASRTYYIRCPTHDPAKGYCRERFKFDAIKDRSKKGLGPVECLECNAVRTSDELLHGLEAVRDQRADDYRLDYLYIEKKVPCPRTFILRPADPKLRNITSWASFVGKRFELTLVSELSGKKVASQEFPVPKEWTKWIRPLTRAASIALTGLAVPLGGEIAEQLNEGAEAMEKLGSLPAEDGGGVTPDHDGKINRHDAHMAVTEAQIHQLNKLLQEIGLDPRAHGMELVGLRDGRWLWMTAEEATAHRRPDARGF